MLKVLAKQYQLQNPYQIKVKMLFELKIKWFKGKEQCVLLGLYTSDCRSHKPFQSLALF